MCHLQQQIVLLESKIASKIETIETLQDEIALLKQDSAKTELELEGAIHVQKTFEQEEKRLQKIIRRKTRA